MKIEHTGVYYDSSHARFIWDGARSPSTPQPEPWIGVNPDKRLALEVKNRIEVKSKKDYGRNCILLIEIPPGVTYAGELELLLLPLEKSDGSERLLGIYIAGKFPNVNDQPGGYQVITVKKAKIS